MVTANPGTDPFSLTKWFTRSSQSRDIILIFLIVFGILCFRRHDSFFNAQLWSEDGTNFLWGYETNGIKSLLVPIDQYIFLVPHIVAVLFGVLNVNLLYIPLCYNISCFFITFLVSVQLWKSAGHLQLKHKILYATCFLLVPVGPDMFMNLANIQWFTFLYIIDYLFVGYQYGNKYVKVFWVTIFAFTGPFAIILSPLVALILFLDRKKLTLDVIMAYLIIWVAGGIALITTMNTDIRHRSSQQVNPSFALPPEHLHFLKMITKNTGDILFVNSRAFAWMPQMVNMAISLVAFAGIVVITVVSYNRVRNPKKYVLPVVALLSFASYVVAFSPNESKLTAFICSRYYFIPFTCMAWVGVLAWDQLIKIWHIALYLVFFLKHKGNVTNTLYDKQWRKQVLEYYQGTRDSIEINEGGPGWGRQVILPHYNKK